MSVFLGTFPSPSSGPTWSALMSLCIRAGYAQLPENSQHAGFVLGEGAEGDFTQEAPLCVY